MTTTADDILFAPIHSGTSVSWREHYQMIYDHLARTDTCHAHNRDRPQGAINLYEMMWRYHAGKDIFYFAGDLFIEKVQIKNDPYIDRWGLVFFKITVMVSHTHLATSVAVHDTDASVVDRNLFPNNYNNTYTFVTGKDALAHFQSTKVP